MLPVNEFIQIPPDEFTWSYARSGGPGGQNVNKVASKATLRWAMAASPSVPEPVKARLRATHPSHVTADGDFLVVSQEYRDQERNRERCREKLSAMLLAAATPPKPRTATKPSKGAKRRRVEDKRRQSAKKTNRKTGGWDD
jgi:ribosome-associated protein